MMCNLHSLVCSQFCKLLCIKLTIFFNLNLVQHTMSGTIAMGFNSSSLGCIYLTRPLEVKIHRAKDIKGPIFVIMLAITIVMTICTPKTAMFDAWNNWHTPKSEVVCRLSFYEVVYFLFIFHDFFG